MRDKEIASCKYCGGIEYYMDMRWLNGKQMCRDCYKDDYENTTGKLYEWDDLDGKRPIDNKKIYRHKSGAEGTFHKRYRVTGTPYHTVMINTFDGRQFYAPEYEFTID